MNLSPETLELYIELQPFFADKKGDWQAGDSFWIDGSIYTIGDYLIEYDLLVAAGYDYQDELGLGSIAWLPDPISRDEANPQRGLWGMVDWNILDFTPSGDGNLIVLRCEEGEWVSLFEAMPPTLALLKALKWQIEQEEK